MTPEIRHLLSGYATGTLTDDERERLFAAALDDQALFDALAEEQPLKDLLDDPESRGYLLAELDQPAQTEVAARMSKMAHSAPAPTSVPTSVSMPPPQTKPTARFWLPFAAVMMGLMVTGWFWWKSAPEPNLEVAAARQSSGAGPRPAFPQGESAKDKPAPSAPAQKPVAPAPPLADNQPPKAAEARQEPARADAAEPLKKEIDAIADKADNAIAPAVIASNLASTAPPAYRLLLLQNGQYVPTSASARFQAGDTIVILLPVPATVPATGPQLALANGPPIALEREGDWYRSAKIELQAGSPEFLVSPDKAASVRSRFATGQEAEPVLPLRIRLTVE